MGSFAKEKEFERSWWEKYLSGILQQGPIPNHVAFIMDGNRRFAAKKHVERIEGHRKGFDKLAEMLRWCQDLDISEVTLYAFSAENFKRSKEEVDSLMELARSKFAQILEEQDRLKEHGVRISIIGELHLLPQDLQELAYKLMECTRNNNKCRLNVCVAYTSRHEMTQAVRDITWGLEHGLIEKSDISEQLFEKALQISSVDVLVRTSGEIRLSDFLLWQSSSSYLSFLNVLWPELTIWDFYWSVLQYQRCYKSIKKQQIATELNTALTDTSSVKRMNNFINSLCAKRDCFTECV
ncbi:unnamed protein product [Clavelina lepadiformis]|uniref:Alkyl transferase n=1 Tax=Clavelina lepadiformis TaxID=159417 RepID=A0ABP0GMK9_CLALP